MEEDLAKQERIFSYLMGITEEGTWAFAPDGKSRIRAETAGDIFHFWSEMGNPWTVWHKGVLQSVLLRGFL